MVSRLAVVDGSGGVEIGHVALHPLGHAAALVGEGNIRQDWAARGGP